MRKNLPKLTDLTGLRFGRWLVLRRDGVKRNGHAAWWCQCDCGVEAQVEGSAMQVGRSSCCVRCRSRLPGLLTSVRDMPEHRSWNSMKSRCLNRNNGHYTNYGGRGITVCDRWRDSFEAFLHDMGVRPTAQHTLERINNAGNYEPGNCRWATRAEQQANTRATRLATISGNTRPVRTWALALGVAPSTVYYRIRRLGMTPEAAILAGSREAAIEAHERDLRDKERTHETGERQ